MAIAHDVVVITTHDIGRHLHCYGVKSVASPNLDALAASGVRFDQAFATAPQCSPSRASLATGRYPHNNGVMGLAHHGFDWDLTEPHAAATFGAAGFATHLFGSQHVSLHPDSLGFDKMHPTDAVEQVLVSGPRERRLYLEVNFDETHRPYPPAGAPPPDLVIPAYLPTGPEAAEELTALERAIAQMDEAAGRVLNALDRSGRADDTVVVFTTDHGLAMPRAKCTLYDPGLEVALIVRWPGGFEGGGARSGLVSNIDVLPTLLDASGVAAPPGVQGQSLLESRDAIFAEKTFHSYYDPMRCIRTPRYKLIRNFETAFAVEVPADIQAGPIFRKYASRYSTDRPAVVELYDLDEDPLEQHNLTGTPGVATIEQDLSSKLRAWMRDTDDPLLKGPISSPRYRLAMEP